MTMIINNQEVEKVLTMADTIAALEKSYLQLAAGEAVCRPRIDIRIPTSDPARNYQWGTMEGGSTAGYFAIRMKSDIIYETEYNGAVTQEKYCLRPGLYCGLILLTSIENGEPARVYQRRVSAAHARRRGWRYRREVLSRTRMQKWSGCWARAAWRARTWRRSCTCAEIEKLQVFSPTRENRERFGREMAAKYNIEVKVCNRPEDVYKGAHILAALTDSAVEVTDGTLLEKGTHIVTVGGSGKPDPESLKRVDVYLRFGDTPAPVGHPGTRHRCRARRL